MHHMHCAVSSALLVGVAVVTLVACNQRVFAQAAPREVHPSPSNTVSTSASASAVPTTTTTSTNTTVPTTTSTALVAVAVAVEPAADGNPVYGEDFPDPYVTTNATGYVAFATNSDGRNVPMVTSSDLVHWTAAGDALPNLPSWAMEGTVWAPSVTTSANGSILYVTIGDSRRGKQCVFAATSRSVEGPYTVVEQPIACEAGGSIDPSTVQDANGVMWLVWKDEPGDAADHETLIRAARLRADGLQIVSAPTTLLTNTAEGVVNVEGPSLVRTASGYTLFFSVGDWRSSTYRTGFATCTTLTESCRVERTDWLSAHDGLDAPGGLEVFSTKDGTTYVAFHTGSCDGCVDPRRLLNIRRLVLGATPAID